MAAVGNSTRSGPLRAMAQLRWFRTLAKVTCRTSTIADLRADDNIDVSHPDAPTLTDRN
jgi:hypothetical protein